MTPEAASPPGIDLMPLQAALEHDHQAIDAAIEPFAAGSSEALDREALHTALTALRRHIYLEEELIFPPLRAAGLVGPIMVMLHEHGQMWELLDELDRLLAAQGADNALIAPCRRLLVLLVHHNPKEERILYPQADPVLGAEEAQRLEGLLTTAAVPAGWVCRNRRG